MHKTYETTDSSTILPNVHRMLAFVHNNTSVANANTTANTYTDDDSMYIEITLAKLIFTVMLKIRKLHDTNKTHSTDTAIPKIEVVSGVCGIKTFSKNCINSAEMKKKTYPTVTTGP